MVFAKHFVHSINSVSKLGNQNCTRMGGGGSRDLKKRGLRLCLQAWNAVPESGSQRFPRKPQNALFANADGPGMRFPSAVPKRFPEHEPCPGPRSVSAIRGSVFEVQRPQS